ncbi:unnamed protein product, partial [Ilex paraguariensis]
WALVPDSQYSLSSICHMAYMAYVSSISLLHTGFQPVKGSLTSVRPWLRDVVHIEMEAFEMGVSCIPLLHARDTHNYNKNHSNAHISDQSLIW